MARRIYRGTASPGIARGTPVSPGSRGHGKNFLAGDNVIPVRKSGASRNILLFANQSTFEVDVTTGIAAVGSCTLTRETGAGNFFAGAASCKAVTGGIGTTEGMRIGASADMTKNFRATPREVYTGSAYVKGAAGGEALLVRLQWFDSSGVAAGSTSFAFTATTSFVRYSVTATAPANAAYGNLLVVTNATIVATFYSDNTQVEHGPTATTWVTAPANFAAKQADNLWISGGNDG